METNTFLLCILALVALYVMYRCTCSQEDLTNVGGANDADYNEDSMEHDTLTIDDESVALEPHSDETDMQIRKKFMTRDGAKDGRYKYSNYVSGKRGQNYKEKALDFIDESNNLMQNGAMASDEYVGADESQDKYAKYAPEAHQNKRNKFNANEIFNSNNYLPNDKSVNPDWFDVVPDAISVKNRHLINVSKPIGINTIGSSLRNPTHDIRGDIANPKFVISPWNQSTIEMDTNLKSLCNN